MNDMKTWDELARVLNTMGPDYDYSKIQELDSRGHGTDLGKLPWHPTFSNESAYHNPEFQGGTWAQNENGYKYTPSVDMVQKGFTKGLGTYMKKEEPNVTLGTPIPMSREYFLKAVR